MSEEAPATASEPPTRSIRAALLTAAVIAVLLPAPLPLLMPASPAVWLSTGALQLALLAAGIALVLRHRLHGPLELLHRHAGAIAAPEAPQPAAWDAGHELAPLARQLAASRLHVEQLFGELERKNAQLRKMAMYDHLTGLPNRTLFRELFLHEVAGARRSQRSMALMFIDLDDFKKVNDALGHASGDELLLGISQRLLGTLRESDIVCRMGGDEFLVLLPDADPWERVAATAERLLHAIELPLPLHRPAQNAQVSASIGVALYPADGEDFDTLARHADLAMYRSKALGRARYGFFHADLDAEFHARIELDRELGAAIARGELTLHFQPVVRVDALGAAGELAGVEALVRWLHPQRGLLMPAAFVPVAEESGLVRELGLWTLDAACRQLAQWKAAGRHPRRMALNVSALQFRDQRLVEALEAALRRHGIAPGEIEIELTESTLMADSESAQRTVAALRALGVALVIDDFGTGYSSLAYLKRLKPDKLKIDRSFVEHLPGDPDDRTLTQAIIGIAHALRIDVVAEGVETAQQRDHLVAAGCHLLQGYLTGRPMPADEAVALLHAFDAPVASPVTRPGVDAAPAAAGQPPAEPVDVPIG